MHGPDATAELRKAGYEGVVVGVTGNVLQDDIDYFLKCGAHAVLSKPLNIPKCVCSLMHIPFLLLFVLIISPFAG